MSTDSLPERGDHVQRIDTGEIGTVELVAVAGERAPMAFAHSPLMVAGDVSVWMSPWRSIVTSGAGFWKKWRRVDAVALADQVILEALRAS